MGRTMTVHIESFVEDFPMKKLSCVFHPVFSLSLSLLWQWLSCVCCRSVNIGLLVCGKCVNDTMVINMGVTWTDFQHWWHTIVSHLNQPAQDEDVCRTISHNVNVIVIIFGTRRRRKWWKARWSQLLNDFVCHSEWWSFDWKDVSPNWCANGEKRMTIMWLFFMKCILWWNVIVFLWMINDRSSPNKMFSLSLLSLLLFILSMLLTLCRFHARFLAQWPNAQENLAQFY